MAKPDWQIVQELLDQTELQDNSSRARAIVDLLHMRAGRRWRARSRHSLKEAAAEAIGAIHIKDRVAAAWHLTVGKPHPMFEDFP